LSSAEWAVREVIWEQHLIDSSILRFPRRLKHRRPVVTLWEKDGDAHRRSLSQH